MRILNVLMIGVALVFGAVSVDAEAKRLGSGRSSGMQRDASSMQKPTPPAAAPQNAASAAGANSAAGAAQPKRSWMGPVAGLAAGLGLAALASHFGFGEELANFMMMALLAVAVLAVIGFVMRRRAQQSVQPSLAGAGAPYGGAGAGATVQRFDTGAQAAGGAAAVPVAAASGLPAGFDEAGFVRQAKVSFVRLQAANDVGDLEDLRSFTTPEMFAEIKMDIVGRGGAKQTTDVVSIEAAVLGVALDAARYVASVRFTGLLREETEAAPANIDEIWHLVKPADGSEGWRLAGIQQTA